MPSRFYYRPVDPGYDRFGAAIANAVGAAGRTIERGRAREREEERYQRQQDRLDEAIAREERRRLAAIERQYQQMGGVSEEEATELTPEGITPGRGIYDSMGVAAPGVPESLTQPADPRLTPIDRGAPGIAGAMQGEPRPTEERTVREGVRVIEDPELGTRYVDPSQSLDAIREELGFQRERARQSKEYQRRLELIQRAMDPESAGGEEITAEELGEIRAMGGTTEPMESLLLAREQNRYRSRGLGGSSLTANRRLTLIEQNILGDAMRMLEQNPDAELPEIVDTLMENPQYRALGRGALDMKLREAVQLQRLGISLAARRAAAQELLQAGIMPGDPGYEEQVLRRAAEIQTQGGDAPVTVYGSESAVSAADRAAQLVRENPDMTEEEIIDQLEEDGYTIRTEER